MPESIQQNHHVERSTTPTRVDPVEKIASKGQLPTSYREQQNDSFATIVTNLREDICLEANVQAYPTVRRTTNVNLIARQKENTFVDFITQQAVQSDKPKQR
jgi:hypothetical protein